jgi:hypothetical protein
MKLSTTLLGATLFVALLPSAFAASNQSLEIADIRGDLKLQSTHIKKATLHLRKAGGETSDAGKPSALPTPAAPLALQAAQKPHSGLLLPAVQKVRMATSP